MINKKCLVIMGAAGAGKDTLASMIEEYLYGTQLVYPVARLRFSAPLKHVVSVMFGLDEERLNALEYKESPLEKVIVVPSENGHTFLMTKRQLLQWFGTDFGRSLDKDLWVRAALKQAEKTAPDVCFFISTDCRFQNEADAVEDTFEEAYFVHLSRIGREVLSGVTALHPSETETPEADIYYAVMDGDLDNLRRIAREIAQGFLEDI